MGDINLNEGQENVVDSQNLEADVESVNEEVATSQQEEKPKQDPDTNAMFAKVRRESEAKARDSVISEMYGESHGIHTYADYKKALDSQKEAEEAEKIRKETGIDPNQMKPIFERWKQQDPAFQELKAIRYEKNTTRELLDLNTELKEAGLDLQLKDLSDEELIKVPNIEKVTGYVQKGHNLADAFFLANKKTLLEMKQQETIKKITSNAESTPGSLADGGGESNFISFEQFEKNKHNQRWMIDNLSKITKSRAKW